LADNGPDMIRAPGRHRLELQHQAPASAPPPSRWTLELLNRERVADLRDMCRVQGIIVSPSRGSTCSKADYVAALLADRDSGLEPSEEQQSGAQHEASDHAIADDFRERSSHHDDCVISPMPAVLLSATVSVSTHEGIFLLRGIAYVCDIICTSILDILWHIFKHS
jgi:hypothetical protein